MKTKAFTTKGAALIVLLCSLFCIFAISGTAASAEATAFVDAVNTLDGIELYLEDSSLRKEKEDARKAAEAALDAYLAITGNSTSDTDIKAAYATLIRNKTDMFTSYVELAAMEHDNNDYRLTRLYLDGAAALIDDIDRSTSYVTLSIEKYNQIEGELREPEETCKTFLSRVEKAYNATKYDDMKSNYDAAKKLENTVIASYPGVAEAKAKLPGINQKIIAIRATISEFADASRAAKLDASDSIVVAVAEALELYEAITDKTAEDAVAAKAELDAYITTHTRNASKQNELIDAQNSLVYALILGI